MPGVRVLIVEDERKLAQALASALKGEHYDVVIAPTGEDGFFRANAEAFDLVVLDVMLPGRSGLEILQTLRQRHIDTPVLILTARDGVDDRVLGLDLGADDYLVKPFALPELLARIRALLRRGRPSEAFRLKAADLEMDLVGRRAVRGERLLDLTAREFELLEYLLRHQGHLVSQGNAGARGLEGAAPGDAARQRDRRPDDPPAQEGRLGCGRTPDSHGSWRRVRPARGRAVKVPWSATSIRVRLTGWYAVVLGLMLIVYAAATFVAVRQEFREQLDDQLHDDFESAEGLLAPAADGRLAWSGDRHHDPGDDEDRASDVWSPTGEQIVRSGASGALPPLALATAGAQPHYESMVANGRRWRTLAGTTLVGGRSVVLRVARSEERLREQLSEVLKVLVLGLPLVIVLAGLGGYLLARRALAPIDHLAVEARRVTAERLHERVSVPNQHDEIGRLAAVINDAFARLESSFDRLRRFTADASHELRTPLAVIRGIGEAALVETRTAAEYKEAIGSMLEEIDRLTTLVDTLLRLSHGDAGNVHLAREPLDLGQLAREAASSLAVLAEERRQRISVEAAERVSVTGRSSRAARGDDQRDRQRHQVQSRGGIDCRLGPR